MSDLNIRVRDMQFVIHELFEFENHCHALGYEEVSRDLVDAMLEEMAKFCENVLAPLNAVGDAEGCRLEGHEVHTPTGFKEAYHQYVAAGWPSMSHETEAGGQGLPESLGTFVSEAIGTANWAWTMYPGLSHGAMRTLAIHGTEAQKQVYLPKLVEGSWTGTMCLTEAHCGTDLGMLRTRAIPQEDGSYRIEGTKIFISAGEHDLADNIVHIVLARLPGAPEGTKGISLFVVPKFLPETNERNAVYCGSLEHKMGIHGNSTCVLNFDGATGFLVGPPNRGLNCMFTFMNRARLGTAMQGLAHAELGYQKSLKYAKERLQMRSLTGAKNLEGPADPIIVHPDVRRMLLTQKALTEGHRMLGYFAALQLDVENRSQDEAAKRRAANMLALLTPIAKAFMTETGFECANLAMQIYGGHGYIRESGVEQNVRDSRIAMLYEGTTGIQALDLLGRKILLTQGESLKAFTAIIDKFCKAHGSGEMQEFTEPLAKLNKQWGEMTMKIGLGAIQNQDEVGAASVDYVMYAGYVTLAYFWALAARVAQEKLQGGAVDPGFYHSKIKTARFYYRRVLPRTRAHAYAIAGGADCMMDFELEDF